MSLEERYRSIVEDVLAAERAEAERDGDEVDSQPGSPATDEQIEAAEKARGRTFHDSYKAFLRLHDGWEHFAWGMSLIGTELLADDGEYEELVEVTTYVDDLEEEIEGALLIGRSEDNASCVFMLDGGEVVEWMYEEEDRHPDLASFLMTRKTRLLEMREYANQRIGRTEREWDPAYRRAEDEALGPELARLLDDTPLAEVQAPEGEAEPPQAVGAHELVVKDDDGDVAAGVVLALTLYLGATPSKDEVLETVRAFRRHIPHPSPGRWVLADQYAFRLHDLEEPDAEPFADELRVDDSGFFGVRLQYGEEDGDPREQTILNIRGIPPETDDYADEDDDDDDEQDNEHPSESRVIVRASFVEVLAPLSTSPEKIEALAEDLCNILPIRSGHGGYAAMVFDTDAEPDPWTAVYGWCRRHFALDVVNVDGFLGPARNRIRGASWLTLLGRPFVEALEAHERLGAIDAVSRFDGVRATLLTAGQPTLGDVARGEFPTEIAEVARTIQPLTIDRFDRRGNITMGGVWFSTRSQELPGRFNFHHATQAYLRRFVEPEGFLGSVPGEQALELIERLRSSFDDEALANWEKMVSLEDPGFSDLLRAVFNGAYYTKDRELMYEALSFAAQYPDWTPPQTYNNLMHFCHADQRIELGMRFMDVALETAANNVPTYHNAACLLVLAGEHDRALECIVKAHAKGYEHMEKVRTDEDLAPLHDRPEFKALFE